MKKNIFSKKNLILIISTLIVLLVLFLFQMPVLKASVQILPIIADFYNLTFGTVFPGEQLERTFEVSYTGNEGSIDYRIIHKIKPINPEDGDYCQQNPNDFQKCYRNLCPYLTEFSNEGEGDTKDDAFVGATDSYDNWIVRLKVPAIFGHVAQDHTGGVVNDSGEYGCDISIDITEAFVIDTIVVPSDGSVVSSAVTLENGEEYLLEANGTAFAGDTIDFDAKYSITNRIPGDTWTDTVSGYESYGPTLLDLKVNDTFIDWGVYSGDHTYTYSIIGDGNPVEFKIYDIHYPNNVGSITVKIYQLP